MDSAAVSHEVQLLQEWIVKLGTRDGEGKLSVPFGTLFRETADIFEALVGTLKAAKKRGIVNFEGQMLLSPAHDKVNVFLLVEPAAASSEGK